MFPGTESVASAVVEKVLRCAEFGVAGVASLGIRGKRVAWRGLTVPRLAAATATQRAASDTRFSGGWRRLVEPFSGQAVFVGTDSKRWWRSRLLTLSVGAGAKPAGISSTVVSRTRTTDLYALVDCSPVGVCPTLAARHFL